MVFLMRKGFFLTGNLIFPTVKRSSQTGKMSFQMREKVFPMVK